MSRRKLRKKSRKKINSENEVIQILDSDEEVEIVKETDNGENEVELIDLVDEDADESSEANSQSTGMPRIMETLSDSESALSSENSVMYENDEGTGRTRPPSSSIQTNNFGSSQNLNAIGKLHIFENNS